MAYPAFRLSSDLSFKEASLLTLLKNLILINNRLELLNKELEKKASDKKYEERSFDFLLIREFCLRELIFIFSLLAKKIIVKIIQEYKEHERGTLERQNNKEQIRIQEEFKEISEVAARLSETVSKTKKLLEDTLRPAAKKASERVSTAVNNTANRLESIFAKLSNPMDPRPNAPFSLMMVNNILNHVSTLLIHHPQLFPAFLVIDNQLQNQDPEKAIAAITKKSDQQIKEHKEEYLQVIFHQLMSTQEYSQEQAKALAPLVLKEIAAAIPTYLLYVYLINRVQQAENALAQASASLAELTSNLPVPAPNPNRDSWEPPGLRR